MTFRPPEPITAEQIKDIVKEAWQELQPVGRGTVATEMPPKHETDDSDYLKAGQVAHKLNCSVRHVWRLVASGEFPKPIRLKRATRWRAVDVDEYLDRKSKG
jgi:predicted DNA-binding transcriptional regulator AlpA